MTGQPRIRSIHDNPFDIRCQGDLGPNHTLSGSQICLDLLVRHPESFLQLVDLQEEKVTKGVVTELLAPVTDKYAREDLLAAVRLAKSAGLAVPLLDELTKVYALPRVGPRPARRKAPRKPGQQFEADLGPT